MQVEDDLDHIKNATSQQELNDAFREFGRSMAELTERAARRQAVSSLIFLQMLEFVKKNIAYYFVIVLSF